MEFTQAEIGVLMSGLAALMKQDNLSGGNRNYHFEKFYDDLKAKLDAMDAVSLIPQDKAVEFMEVSALVCMDIDILLDIAKQGNQSAEDLVWQIEDTYRKKEEAIHDATKRHERYQGFCSLFSINRGKT